MLSADQLTFYQNAGHVTVPAMFSKTQIAAALSDIETWSNEFFETLTAKNRNWYLEDNGASRAIRKLDDPVYRRKVFRDMARDKSVVAIVEQIIGTNVSVCFSQVFCKPPEVGGPKPIHQDNFYFGPDDEDAMVTVWIALDDATEKNGCLFYGDGSNRGPVLPHVAPADQPFNLQIPEAAATAFEMTAAPVAAGGVSFHHGNTWHQSSANTSPSPRRAVAFHYIRNNATLRTPALPYDLTLTVSV